MDEPSVAWIWSPISRSPHSEWNERAGTSNFGFKSRRVHYSAPRTNSWAAHIVVEAAIWTPGSRSANGVSDRLPLGSNPGESISISREQVCEHCSFLFENRPADIW